MTQRQLDQVQSLCDTQNLMIKRLQEQLGEEAEFEPDMDPHVRRVHLDYEGRIADYEERIRQLYLDCASTIIIGSSQERVR